MDRQAEKTLWVIEQRELWGDYGDVLVSGYARRETDDGPLFLHRTGPFLPPVSFPWVTNFATRAVVVTGDVKHELEALHLPGLTFREAIKARIVSLSWEAWDLTSPEPAAYPDEGEPENYVWEKQHDAPCAAMMGDAFELAPPTGPLSVKRIRDDHGRYLDDFAAKSNTAGVPPISRSHPTFGQVIVDDEMKAWLEKHARAWVRFSPVRRADGGGPAVGE